MAKASAKETFQKLAARYRGKGTKLFLAGMVLLLVIRIIVYGTEATFETPLPPTPSVPDLPRQITEESASVRAVQTLSEPLPEFMESNLAIAATYNMFDPKQVQNAAQIERRANEQYEAAFLAYRQGQYEAALQRVEEVLQQLPTHLRASDLRKQILQRLGRTPQPEITPVPGGDGATTGTAEAAPADGAVVPTPPAQPE